VSAHFIDPPGPLANTSEPIDFTTDKSVTSISIEYNPHLGNGVRETVWDGTSEDGSTGGDFSYAYRKSSRSSDGLTWHIVRSTRWPDELRIRIQEAKSDPTPSTTTWSTLYSRDLTTLASQTITGPSNVDTYGNFTMDSQPWYWHGASGRVNLVNGQGLVGQVNAASINSYFGFYVGLRVYAMAGYDPAKETICQVTYSGALSALPTTGYLAAGMWTGSEEWGYGPGNNAQHVLLGRSSVIFHDVILGNLFTRSFAAKSPAVEDASNFCLALRTQPFDATKSTSGKFNYRSGYFERDITAMPDPEGLVGLGAENGLGTAQTSNYKMGFYAGSTSGVVSFVATKIRIMQRAVT
jgi:hypothetical protein